MLYSSGNLGISFANQVLVGFIMFFGTDVMSIDAKYMGIAFTIGIVWDAITDPVAGHLSDRTVSKKFGRRHGYILFGTFLLSLANIFLWCLPISLSAISKFFWMLFGILLFQTCCMIINIPYNALAFDLVDDYNEQTELQGMKSIFFILGIILPIAVMASLETIFGSSNPAAYRNLAYIGSAIILVCGLITFFGTRSYIPHLNKKAKLANVSKEKFFLRKIIKNFFKLFKDVNYRSIIIAVCAINISSAFLTGIGLHVFTYTFNLGTWMYLLMGELFVVVILSQPLWLYICQRTDKKPSLMNGLWLTAAGIILFAIIFSIRDFINTNALIAVLTVPIVVIGIGIGSTYLIPQSMLADVIAYNSKEDEVNNNATVMGFMTFTHKIAQAIALLIIGFMISAVGFDSSADSATYMPELKVRNGLGIILIVGVAAGIAVALIFISKYKLKKEDIKRAGIKAQKDNEGQRVDA